MRKDHIPVLIIGSILLCGCGSTQNESTQDAKAASVVHNESRVEYAFTQAKQHPEKKLVELFDGAKSNLDIAIYSLTQKDIVQSILDAKKRGVNVRIITDRTEAKTKSQSAVLHSLIQAGIPVKENTHKGLMHLKVSIIDKSTVTTGSFNYTAAASTINDEVFVVIPDTNIAENWDAQFERMWNDTANFEDVK